jgi:hypothetical protein
MCPRPETTASVEIIRSALNAAADSDLPDEDKTLEAPSEDQDSTVDQVARAESASGLTSLPPSTTGNVFVPATGHVPRHLFCCQTEGNLSN